MILDNVFVKLNNKNVYKKFDCLDTVLGKVYNYKTNGENWWEEDIYYLFEIEDLRFYFDSSFNLNLIDEEILFFEKFIENYNEDDYMLKKFLINLNKKYIKKEYHSFRCLKTVILPKEELSIQEWKDSVEKAKIILLSNFVEKNNKY